MKNLQHHFTPKALITSGALFISACTTNNYKPNSVNPIQARHNKELSAIASGCQALNEEFKEKNSALEHQKPEIFAYNSPKEAVAIIAPQKKELGNIQDTLQGYTREIKQSYRSTLGIFTNEAVYYDTLKQCHPFQ